jgi:hypothetical protein
MTNAGLVLILVLSGITLYLVWDTYYVGNLEVVRSTVDGRDYQVQSLPDKQEAANLLARIREQLVTLASHLSKMYPQDERTVMIQNNFNPDRISEGAESEKYTSYSINKGERIVFCLRQRDASKQLMDVNTMTFVALHELAHVASKDVGHTPNFWDNFRWLLEEAIQIGIYRKQNFREKPVPYCGITITDSPLPQKEEA